jgi:hypothetical protein
MASEPSAFAWAEWLRRAAAAHDPEALDRARQLADTLSARLEQPQPGLASVDRLDDFLVYPAATTEAMIRLAEFFVAGGEPDRARPIMDRVAGRRDSVLGTVWDARAAHEEVRLARIAREPIEERSFQAQALALYETVGDDVAYAALSRTTMVPADLAEEAFVDGAHVRLSMEAAGVLTIDRNGDSNVAIQSELSQLGIGQGDGLDATMGSFARSFSHDWRPTAQVLGRILGGGLSGNTLEIEVVDPYLATLPWEIAWAHPGTGLATRFPEGLVRTLGVKYAKRNLRAYLERLVATSSWGDISRPAAERLTALLQRYSVGPNGAIDQRAIDMLHRQPTRAGRVRVLVVRSSLKDELLWARGSHSHGLDVADTYRFAGFEVEVVEGTSGIDLEGRIARWQPDILHIAGRLESSSGGGAFSIEVPSRRSDQSAIDVQLIDRCVAGNVPSPVVVLEPARPAATVEAVRHLLIRNQFAGQLLALGRVSTVVATGLFGPNDLRLFPDLVAAWGAGASLLDGCVATRLSVPLNGSPTTDDLIGAMGTALFVDLGARAMHRIRS